MKLATSRPRATARRAMRRLSLVAALALLGACATTPPSGLHADAPLAAQDGAFLLRVVANAPSAGPYFKNWAGMSIVAVNPDGSDGHAYVVPASLDGASRSALFVASLPPGRYRLKTLSSAAAATAAVQTSQWLDVGPRFPRFDVQAGQLTDLGAIVQTMRPGSTRQVELSYDAQVDHAIASDLVRELSPRLAPLLGKPLLGWAADTTDARATTTAGTASAISVGLVDPHVLPDGSLLAGSYDGMVKTGTRSRPARLADVGQRVAIEAVAVLPDSSWVVAGEYGMISQSADEGRTWHSLRGDLAYGLVSSVHAVSGRLVATVLRGNRVIVASTVPGAATPPHWVVHATYTPSTGPFWEWKSGMATHSFVVGHQVITAMPSTSIGVWDAETGQSVERKLPDMVERFATPGGDVLRFMSPSGMFSNNNYMSQDAGLTWEKLPTLPFVWGVAMKDKLHGVGWATDIRIGTGNFLKTADGGHTWVRTRFQGVWVPKVFLDPERDVAYGADVNGDLWFSTDGGDDWSRAVF